MHQNEAFFDCRINCIEEEDSMMSGRERKNITRIDLWVPKLRGGEIKTGRKSTENVRKWKVLQCNTMKYMCQERMQLIGLGKSRLAKMRELKNWRTNKKNNTDG